MHQLLQQAQQQRRIIAATVHPRHYSLHCSVVARRRSFNRVTSTSTTTATNHHIARRGMASHDSSTTSWIGATEDWTRPSTDEVVPLLSRYSVWYAAYHGYTSLVVCAIGIIGNVFNVVVLTRPNMASSSTNCILTALAVSDLLTMVVYVPFAIQFYCLRPPAAASSSSFTPVQANTLGWTVFLLFYVHTSVTAHTVSIWLAVLLSVARYAYIRPLASTTVVGGRDGNLGRVRCAIVGVYTFAVIILIPNYLSLVMRQTPSTTASYNGQSLHSAVIGPTARLFNPFTPTVAIWVQL